MANIRAIDEAPIFPIDIINEHSINGNASNIAIVRPLEKVTDDDIIYRNFNPEDHKLDSKFKLTNFTELRG